jgi:hypothetical protein
MVVSYMLRCYREQSQGPLKIYARNIQSGEEKYFTNLDAATAYIKRHLEEIQPENEGGESC